MDKQDLMLGVLIASFFKGGLLLPAGCRDQIMAGVKVSRDLLRQFESVTELEPTFWDEIAEGVKELSINVTAQDVGVYLQPEWAAKEGTDKNFYMGGDNIATATGISLVYTVPVAKTLYITQGSFSIVANLAADRDTNQIGVFYIVNATIPLFLMRMGGNGGGQFILPKPLVVVGGHTINIDVINYANHSVNLALTCLGYEV